MRDQGPYGPGSPSQPGDAEPGGPDARIVHGRFGAGPQQGTNGHPSPDPVGRRIDPADAELDDGPVDLVELQADDELINALSSGLGVSAPGGRGYDVDDRLVALLSSWKADVDHEPVPELVPTDEAVAMLQPAKPSRRISFLRPLVAAAAVAACALGVISVGAYEAQPGDALWGVSRVLYSERAEHVQAAADLRTGIERVNAKLAAGDTAGARADLAALGPLLDRTAPDRRDEFTQQSEFLEQKVAETPPGTRVDPRAPLRDGTPAPPPPLTEGRSEQPSEPAEPGSGTSTSGETSTGDGGGSGSSTPGSSSPGSSTGGSSSPEGGQDPSVLSGPGEGSSEPTGTEPSGSPQPSPTSEGSADPSTATPTPTASGEDGDEEQQGPPSSTSTGAVSSTPN